MIVTEGFRQPQSLLAWQLLLIMGLVPTAAAYLLFFGGLKLVEATKASVFAIVEPISAATLGFLFFQEWFSYDSFAGFVLIISSIILISTSKASHN